MADYKKKKVKKVKLGKVKNKKPTGIEVSDSFDIKMESAERPKKTVKRQKKPKKAEQKNDGSLKLIRGNKSKKKNKSSKAILICVLIVLVVFFLNYLSPTGLVETFKNKLSAAGSGELPATLESADILSVAGDSSNAYILSDTNFEIYNSRGKRLNNVQHGFMKPSIAVSENRSLVYDRSGNKYKVLNNSEILYSEKLKNSIYSADISRSGIFAFSTKSKGYTSEVSVFNKTNQTVYTLYSAENIITDVALNNAGNLLATSELSTKGGKFLSKICVYSFDSATPKFSFELSGEPSLCLANLNDGFAVINSDKIVICNWDNGDKTECSSSGDILSFNTDLNGNLVYVSGRNNDYSNNKITVYNDFEKQGEWNVDYSIKDISIYGSSVFILNSETVNLYDAETGEKSNSFTCEFTCSDIAALNKNSVVAISQSKMFVLE